MKIFDIISAKNIKVLFWAVSIFVVSALQANTYWIDANEGNNSNIGTQANPYLDLNKALSVASNGDTIIIKPGTYSGNNNKNLNPGQATLVITSEYPTEPDSVVFDAGGNARHIIIDGGQGNGFEFIGISFIGGNPTDNAPGYSFAGGSILIETYFDGSNYNPTSPKFVNCVFKQNHSNADGGAIHIHGGSPKFENCKIIDNTAGYSGGGVSIYGSSWLGYYTDPTFTNVELLNNKATGDWGTYAFAYGGGVSIWDMAAPSFTDCKFESNIAGSSTTVDYGQAYGGGVYINNGYDIGPDLKAILITNSTLINNSAYGSVSGSAQGGGVYIGAETYLTNCLIVGNTLGSANELEKQGAGVHIDSDAWQKTVITNNTIFGNDGGPFSKGGGVFYWGYDEELFLFNTIIEGNAASNNKNILIDNSNNLYAGFNNIQDGSQYAWFNNYLNFDIESSFNDPDNGDYTLADNSFLIGRGTNSFEGFSAPIDDIYGNSRPATGYNPEAVPVVYGPDLGVAENILEVTEHPSPPENLIVSSNYHSLLVSWSPSKETDIDYYVIYVNENIDFIPVAIDSAGFTAHPNTSFTITGLANGTPYYVKVQAVDLDGLHSSFSIEAVGIPDYIGPVWWVDDNASGSAQDGSEVDPFGHIKQALTYAENGDTIRFNAGTYSGANNREVNFNVTSLVIESEHPDSVVIFDAGTILNARHFILDEPGMDSSTFKIIGLTFINGDKTGDNETGGSISIYNGASATLLNCIFTDNHVTGNYSTGGALSLHSNGDSRIVNCTFDGNSASQGGGAISINDLGNSTKILNTTIINNIATGGRDNSLWDYQAIGGGVAIFNGSPLFENCRIDSNLAGDNWNNSSAEWRDGRGGGVFIAEYATYSIVGPRFVNTTFIANEAIGGVDNSYGGAVDVGSGTDFINCVFAWNEANVANETNQRSAGAAIRVGINQQYDNPNWVRDTLKLINCTIVDNEGIDNFAEGGGLWFENQQNLVMFNTILYGNNAANGTNYFDWNNSAVIFAGYNNIEDGHTFSAWFDETNSWDINPGFTDPDNADYSLLDASPLIGEGTAIFEGEWSASGVDILGATRGTPPDIGAYENSYTTSPAPLPVSDLEIVSVANERVTLSWTANPTAVDSYRVYISKVMDFDHNTADSSLAIAGNLTSVIVSGLTNLTEYFFLVTAENNGWESLVSDEVSAIPYGAWYVGKNGDNSNPGTETQPFATLKKALEKAVTGDTIRIKPSGDTPYSGIGFRALNGTHLKNGIVIESTKGPDSTIISAGGLERHMYFNSGQDTTFKVIGITFTDGKTSQPDWNDSNWEGMGGAIKIGNASPYFEDCVFKTNVAYSGGGAVGIHDQAARPVFKNCKFTENNVNLTVDFWYGYKGGGAVYVHNGSAVFVECEFDLNSVTEAANTDFHGYGGAILVGDFDYRGKNKVKIERSIFTNNSVTVQLDARGSAIFATSPVMISNSQISKNSTESFNNQNSDGAAIAIETSPQWDNGGFYVIEPSVIRNSTIVANEDGGVWNVTRTWYQGLQGNHLILFNNIIWGNSGNGVWDGDHVNSRIFASNNNIQGASGYNWFNNNPNVSFYPLFSNSSEGDYSLSDRSYMIGGGISSFEGFNAPAKDINGKARPTPLGSNPDLGAYEHDFAETPAPGWVSNLKVVGTGHQSIDLEWTAPSDEDLAYYIVYASETNGFVPSLADSLTQTSGTETSFTVSGLTNGVTYYFRVAAVDADGWIGVGSAQAEGVPNYLGPWYVATDGNDSNEGSEGNPFRNLKKALEIAVDGDSILIKAGTYSGNNNINIMSDELTNGIVIKSVDGPGLAVFDAQSMGTPHMHFEHNQDTTFKVIGLKFINGYTPAIDNSQPWFNDGWNYGDYPIAKGFGGSIVIGNQNNYSGASPQFIDCIFEGNHSERMGGAVAIAIGSPVFKNVTFKDNQAGSGGAVFVSDPWDSATRNATFINCSFENNIAFSSLNDWMMGTGGAVNIGYNDNLSDQFLFEGCIFIGNLAEQSLNDGSFVRANGGAITTHSNIKVVNSLFDGNVARSTKSAAGGAVNIDINMNNNGGTGVFINNTFVNNHIEGVEEEFSPAVHFSSFSDNSPSAYTFFNNIVYGNTTTNFSSTPVDIHWGSAGYNMSTDFNLIEGIGGHSIFDQPNTISNLGPSFNDFANGDYTLNQFSPALEAGTANFNGYDAPSNDITGGQRALPPGSNPDLGAYEAGPAMHVAMTLDSVEVGSEDMIEVAKGDSATLALTIQSWDDPPIPAEDGTKINWFVFPENLQGVTPLKEDTVTTGGLAAVKFKIEDTAQSGQGFVIYAEVDNKFTVMGPKIFVDQIVTDPPPAPENLTASPDYWTSGDIFTLTWNSTDWINGIKGANVSINGSTPNYHPIDNVAPSVTGSVSQTGVCEVRVWLVDNLDNQSESNASITYIRRDVNPPSSITWASPGGWIKSNDVEFSWSGAGDDYGLEGYEIVLGTGNYEDASKQEIEGFYLDGSSTSWTYSGNLPSNLTWFTVTAYDSAGNFGGIFWQNLQIDDSPPNVWHNPPGEFVQEGQNANLNVQWDDSQSGINMVQIHIRPGDQDWYSSGDIANGGGFNGIPGQDIYTAGVEYYIEAFDNAGNRGRDPQNEGETYTIRVQTNQYSSYDYYPSGMHSGTTVSDYSIVSVPLERNNTSMNTVFSEFGGTNNTQWRLYGWNGSSYYENPSSINPGEGYFLITSQANRNINTGQGTSFPLNQQFDIPVTPNQWNFIGNPYDFPVPLNALHLNNGGDIYSEGTYYFFLGDWDGSPSELNPFEGLIFKPTTATSIQIFPWEFANTAKQSASNKNLLDEELTEGEWQVQVDVSNRVASDKLNIMGARQESTPYFDNVDAFEPPVAPGGIGMSIRSKVNEETIDKLAIDMRPITEDGHYWDLEVNSSIKNENVELTFNEMETIPDNFEAFIVDVDLNIAQNLKWKNTYRYLAEASGRTHNLRLLVGDKEFVEKNNAGVALYPDEYALGQNFPNPFNPRTSMILGMKDEGFVDLAIYNILGQEVRRFASNEFRPAGYYNITWNGLNQNREKVATGTYLVVASVKDASGKVKLQQVRKMLLLK